MKNVDISQLTDGQSYALDLMLSGENVFLTGEAGTGKSEVVKLFIRMSEQNGKQILVTAPTGTAADNLHGETIHRTFGADIGVQKNNRALTERKDILKVADIVIIDEISMCRFDLFEYVARRIVYENEQRARDRMMKLSGYLSDDDEVKENDLQLIVIGDFYQLPPVITQDDAMELSAVYKFDYGKGYAFVSPYWKTMNFTGVILKEIVRQDDKAFKGVLSEIRHDNRNSKNTCIDFLMRNSSDFPMTGDDAIFLVPTNKKCKEINDREMAKLDADEKVYVSTVDGDVKSTEKFADDEIILKVGCKVMTTINDPSGRYVNGTIGKVTSLMSDSISIITEDEQLVTIGKTVKEITAPVVKTKKVKKFVDQPVLDENGVPKVDENDHVIMRQVLKEVDEQTISHEKVGTFKQMPVRVAYAITVHKSQGKTFAKINLDPYAWDPGQFYTALSRGKKIENICFLQTIRPKFIITSPEVKKFMKEIENAQKKAVLEFEA